jgi:hypothetical protein
MINDVTEIRRCLISVLDKSTIQRVFSKLCLFKVFALKINCLDVSDTV